MTIERPGKSEFCPAARYHCVGGVRGLCLLPAIFLLMLVCRSNCQDIEPRRWSHLPIGSNHLTAGYAMTTGDIFLDPVLRLEDVEFELDTIALKYVRSF